MEQETDQNNIDGRDRMAGRIAQHMNLANRILARAFNRNECTFEELVLEKYCKSYANSL